MSSPEIISESFVVHLADGKEVEYLKQESNEFIWRSDPAGTLYIYNKEYHKTFTTAVIKDQRVASYAPGYWQWVEVLESTSEVEDENPADNSVIVASK